MDQITLQQTLSELPIGALRYFNRVSSTNDLAARWAEAGAPDLALVVADEQTAGRGRLNRRWFTPPGASLAFSLVLRPIQPEVLSHYTGLGALAVCETLNDALPPVLPAQIKWPNDVIATRRKLAGVLAEAQWSGEQLTTIILGVGVNVSAASVPPADTLSFPATCLEEVVEGAIDRWELLKAVLNRLLNFLPKVGTQEFMQAWRHRLAFRGEWVQVNFDPGAAGEPTHVQEGQVAGLDDDGSLRLRLGTGEIISLQNGEIQLRPVDTARK